MGQHPGDFSRRAFGSKMRNMDFSTRTDAEVVPEHFLAFLYGVGGMLLGTAVWSGVAVVYEPLSWLLAPALGWMVGWAARYGGRRADPPIRATAILLSLCAALAGLFVTSAFASTQVSPDAGFQPRQAWHEYVRIFLEMPWLGDVVVVLTLVGAWWALRVPARPGTRAPVPGPAAPPATVAGGGARSS